MEWKLVIFGLMLCSWMSLLWRVTIAGFYSEAHLHIYCSSRLDTWQSYLSIFTSSAYGIYCRKISCLSTPVVFISIQVALILLVLVFTYNNPNPGLLLAEIVQISFRICTPRHLFWVSAEIKAKPVHLGRSSSAERN